MGRFGVAWVQVASNWRSAAVYRTPGARAYRHGEFLPWADAP